MTEKTLRDDIQELIEVVKQNEQKKKQKKFRLPFRSRVSKRKVKEGYAIICYINENKGVDFFKLPVEEGTIMAKGAPHIATAKYMLNHKNKPFMIVPSWNTEPFSPERDMTDASDRKTLTVGQRLLLNRLKAEVVKPKMKIGFGTIILFLIGAAVAIYLFSGGF